MIPSQRHTAPPANLLFVSPCRHNQLRQRHQAFAAGFADAGFRVFFLNPFLSGGFHLKSTATADSGVTVLDLHLPFRATKHPGLQMIACRFARYLLKNHGLWAPRETILWVADPAVAFWSDAPWRRVCYDRCDRHGFFPGQRQVVWQSYEGELYHRSSFIACSSSVLQQDVPHAHRHKTVLVPNAAPPARSASSHACRPCGPPWRAISAGAHYEWTDMDWLRRFLEVPPLKLELAGPGRGAAFQRLISHPQVRYHGTLPHAELQILLANCHVGLIPFVDTPLTRGVDPVKIYEYAQSGLQVWVPPIPGLDSHVLTTAVVNDPQSIAEAAQGLREPPPTRVVPTWNDRIRQVVPFLYREASA